MATFFANFMPWIALFWTISFLYFVDKIRSDQLGIPSLLDGGALTHHEPEDGGNSTGTEDEFEVEYSNLIPAGA